MLDNIEYSKDWLVQEIIKTDFKEKATNKKDVIKISKVELLKLVLAFIKLNEIRKYIKDRMIVEQAFCLDKEQCSTILQITDKVLGDDEKMTPEEKINKALEIAFEYGQIDGSHYKAWVIDQIVRILLGDEYKNKIKEYMFEGKDEIEALQTGDYYDWDTGIAP